MARNPLRLLRSPRLAAWLIALNCVYLAAATALAGRFPALYSGPLFLALATLLTAATAACAWERTRATLTHRGLQLKRFRIAADDSGEATAAAHAAVTSLGLRAHPEEDDTVARRLGIARWGSALFHWSLVALFMFAALGQATRFDGTLLLFAGVPAADTADSYTGTRSAGPLFRTHSGVTLELSEAQPSLVVAGIERGPSPRIALTPRGGATVERWVYPNKPLRSGAITIHRTDQGPAVVLRPVIGGTPGEPQRIALRRPDDGGPYSAQLKVEAPDGSQLPLVVTQQAGGRVMLAAPGGGEPPTVIGVGEQAGITDDLAVRIDELSVWATVVVVNDWSVPWLYAAFAAASLFAAVALFYPYREVRVARQSDAIEVTVRTKKIDPAFADWVEQRVRSAVDRR